MACCDACEKTGGSCGGGAQPPKSIPYVTASPAAVKTTIGPRGLLEAAQGLGDTTTVVNPPPATPWGTYALIAAGAAALGALGTMMYGRKSNPAHEDFVGRRIELHPGHDLWMRGARYGEVVRVEKDVLVVRMDNAQVKKLVRVKKDRVTLI